MVRSFNQLEQNMKKFNLQLSPFVVPTDDGKIIEEHFGLASIDSPFSLARMVAPPGWSEPFQTPEFDEITLVIRGKKQIAFEEEVIVLNAGESIRISKGVRLQYSNPFDEPCEYISVCSPAFSIHLVNRESE